MLALKVSVLERTALKALSYVVPTLQIIPSSATSAEKQYRDPIKRKECEEDELTIPGKTLRVASACTCVDLAFQIREDFPSVFIPLLCMIANEDVVVNNEGSLELIDRATSKDKTLKRYDALHGLLCEPPPLVDQIQKDLLDWMDERVR
jgi:alpha-beta hydrolase superfamily lysophospholipase